MSIFWLTILTLLMTVSALLLIAGWRGEICNSANRDTLNKTFYHQRLAELEADEAQGVLAERQEMVRELQQTLLIDIPDEAAPRSYPVGRWVLLPGIAVIFIVSLGLYSRVGDLPGVIALQQAKNDLPALRARVIDPNAKPLTMEELARLRSGIRASLQHHPQNINDWMMLGRLGIVQDDAATATQAFQRALRLAPMNVEVKLSYAEVLTRSSDPQDNQQGDAILNALAKRDGMNMRVLALQAVSAFRQQQYPRAINIWQRMLTLLPASDRRVTMIKRNIAQAKAVSDKQDR